MTKTNERLRRRRSISPSATVAKFVLAGLVSMIVISLAMFTIARRDARSAAVREARDIALSEGVSAVSPVLSNALLNGDAGAIAKVDDIVRSRVLSDRIVRVKLWSEDGTVIYSDDASTIGQRFGLGAEELAALRGGSAEAEISNLDKPENASERSFSQLLEVYDGTQTVEGTPVLFEAYLRFSSVEASGTRLATAIVPALLGGVAVLFVIQIPLAFGLARSLRQGQEEREILLQRSLEAVELERGRIASDLHDGVVQNLAGSSYVISAAAESLAGSEDNADVATRLRDVSVDLRQTLRELRTLIVAIAPPRLHEEGLDNALDDAASPLRKVGVEVAISNSSVDLSRDAEALVYRVINEALRNVMKHAHARRVEVNVSMVGRSVVCSVADDGVGFDEMSTAAQRAGGHVGLALLSELVANNNGALTVVSAPGEGTTVTARTAGR